MWAFLHSNMRADGLENAHGWKPNSDTAAIAEERLLYAYSLNLVPWLFRTICGQLAAFSVTQSSH